MWGRKKDESDAVRLAPSVEDVQLQLTLLKEQHLIDRKKFQMELDDLQKKKAWETERAVVHATKALQKELSEEKMARIDAEARLEAYEEYDAKHDRKQLEDHLSKLIGGVSDMLGRMPASSESRIVVEKS
jgi:hypothetical protein